MRHGGGQKAQGGDQHGHHDRAKAQKSAFLGGFTRAHATRPELVDVFDHDHSDLDRYSNEGQEPQTRRHGEMRPCEQQAEQATKRRETDNGPIAAPMVGGMITSTIHVLILVPVFFVMMKERALRRGRLQPQVENKEMVAART
jgi:hypothetical protein